MLPNIDQDFRLTILASMLWNFVFDCFTGCQAMTMMQTKDKVKRGAEQRFSYGGNPRWEIADRSVLKCVRRCLTVLSIRYHLTAPD